MKNVLFALLVVLTASSASAQERVRIGLLPFDIANVGGGTYTAAQALAKLVRVEMITDKRVQPVLLEVPAGARLPLSTSQLATLATENDLHMIIAGTILDAETTRGRNRVSTRGLGGRLGSSVGTSVSRTRAEVSMHVELVTRDGEVSHAFQVEGNNTDVGVGADIWTSLGGFDVGDAHWDKSPMGKALREAAQKLAAEAIKRRP
ncbi:MAG TPA: CsgG/HfaB family protein [Vicinamibacterales bacterium]|nr:CsgG/HfaB family protein [Vicinamibacterales bacterium]